MNDKQIQALNFPYCDLSGNKAEEIKQDIINEYDNMINENAELKIKIIFLEKIIADNGILTDEVAEKFLFEFDRINRGDLTNQEKRLAKKTVKNIKKLFS